MFHSANSIGQPAQAFAGRTCSTQERCLSVETHRVENNRRLASGWSWILLWLASSNQMCKEMITTAL
jgi:hypothetical protein